ncbi:MAG: Gfo/Idh/MocA family oxidoreductase [Clostridia bacterium]|nr:Gfo/Idh/MocA family oxidoreductase [Clostridia bacterium]
MKTAIIGCGVIGRLHARVIPNYAELAAVCDVNPAAMEICPDLPHYTDYRQMLDEICPDSVHICTPHYLHADMIVDALSRGIHVLCEKPLCIREEDIPRILAAEAASGAQLGVCLQNRYHPANRAVREYLGGGCAEMGIGQVSWHRDAAYYASGDWRGKWATEGGGVLINQALHTLDLMQWFCGMPEQLTAAIANLTLQNEIEVEDTASLIAAGGAAFNFYASIGAVRDCPVEITLRAGGEWIKVMPSGVLFGDRYVDCADLGKQLGKACYGTGHTALIGDWYDCLASGRKFAIDGTEGAKVVRLILAAYRSRGEWVKV